MKGSIRDINRNFMDIKERVENIYDDISTDKKYSKKSKRKGNSLWDSIFPGVLLIKNTEEIKSQLNEILNITNNLKSEVPNNHYREENENLNGFMEEVIFDSSEIQDNASLNLSNVTHSDNINVNNHVTSDSNEIELNKDKQVINSEENRESISPEPLALEFIKLRDKLLVAKYNADEKTLKFINGIYKETGRILNTYGIESLEECGEFNSQYQTIVDTKETDNSELKDQIAESYRPGYKMNGKFIRSQEVVLYTYTENDSDDNK